MEKLLKTIGEGVSVFLDLSAVLAKFIAITGLKSLQWLADGVAGVASFLSGAYKVIKGVMDNGWLSALATAGGWVVEGIAAAFTGGGAQALSVALGAAANGLWDKVQNTWDGKTTSAIVANGFSAAIDFYQMQQDRCNSMSLEQYYSQGC